MTDAEKKAFVKTLLNDSTVADGTVEAYLLMAKTMIINKMHPFEMPDNADIPTKYEITQCKLARNLYLRQGSEGEISHNENGISRTYGSVNDDEVLNEVTPYLGL